MTKTPAKIIELFKTLDQTEQREVAQQLYERAVMGSFHDRMTPQQRVELDEGIAQAERGQVRQHCPVDCAWRGRQGSLPSPGSPAGCSEPS
jgi:hypothetical protein